MSSAPRHIPVLEEAFVSALQPRDGAIIVDGTFGGGGHSRRILLSAACTLYAIDRDPDAIAGGAALRAEFPDRLHLLMGCFGDMESLLARQGIACVDAIGLDIGFSSMQVDDAARGWSFKRDGPLDLRMSQSGPSARDLVNEEEEGALANLLFRYGEERQSRRIARAIVAARANQPITRTLELADIVRKALGYKAGPKDPATRTFQALRIAVNDELGELERALRAAERLLRAGGALAVISFHSLEDRIVKQFMRNRAGLDAAVSRHLPDMQRRAPSFAQLSRALRASDAELNANPRARSATLRAAIRTEAPAWEMM
jgi:16S rRNA (cytosine1402-N4)-methyltransferase